MGDHFSEAEDEEDFICEGEEDFEVDYFSTGDSETEDSHDLESMWSLPMEDQEESDLKTIPLMAKFMRLLCRLAQTLSFNTRRL